MHNQPIKKLQCINDTHFIYASQQAVSIAAPDPPEVEVPAVHRSNDELASDRSCADEVGLVVTSAASITCRSNVRIPSDSSIIMLGDKGGYSLLKQAYVILLVKVANENKRILN